MDGFFWYAKIGKSRRKFVDFIRIDEYNVIKRSCGNESKGRRLMTYLSIAQTAEKWGISPRRIQILCGEGRIPTAIRIGRAWAIPDDAEKPADARIKSGKYIKRKNQSEDNVTESKQS